MNSHSGKDQKGKSQSVANNMAPQNGKNSGLPFTDNRPEAIAQRKLKAIQLQAKNPVPPPQEAMPETPKDTAPVQRVILTDGNEYDDGITVKTSGNFDTRHVIDGAVTNELASQKRTERKVPRSTIVSKAALIREADGDPELEQNADTQTVTMLYNFSSSEAKVATSGGVLHAPAIGVMSRSAGAKMFEVHHLDESEQQLDTSEEEFPALGSA